MPAFKYKNHVGTFTIEFKNGKWHAVFDGQSVGAYSTPEQAAEDLAGGHTFSVTGGYDTAKLDIPEDLGEWERFR